MTDRDYECDECQEFDWLISEAYSLVTLASFDRDNGDDENYWEYVALVDRLTKEFKAHQESEGVA